MIETPFILEALKICAGSIIVLVAIFMIFKFIEALGAIILSLLFNILRKIANFIGSFLRENSKKDTRLSKEDDETIGFFLMALFGLALLLKEDKNHSNTTNRPQLIDIDTQPITIIENTEEEEEEEVNNRNSPFYFEDDEDNLNFDEEYEDTDSEFNQDKSSLLSVFLIHSSKDKSIIRDINRRLQWHKINTWFDEENISVGQNWNSAIKSAIKKSDVVIVFLSKNSINREGYVTKEINIALDIANEKLEDTIYIIPAKLEKCEVPEKLSEKQWVDLFDEKGFNKLIKSLGIRAKKLNITEPSLLMHLSKEELINILKQIDDDKMLSLVAVCSDYDVVLNDYNLVKPETTITMLRIAERLQKKHVSRNYYEEFHKMKIENENLLVYIFKDTRVGVSIVIACRTNIDVVNLRKSIESVFKNEFGLIINFSLNV